MTPPTKSTTAVQYRIRTDLAQAAKNLAQHRGVTESRLIEELLIEALREENLLEIDTDDPRAALEALLQELKIILEPSQNQRAANAAAILTTFNKIKDSPVLLKLYTAAMEVPPGVDQSAEGRRQYVHQRIARFVKTFLGMTSVREKPVPPGSIALIKSYTELA